MVAAAGPNRSLAGDAAYIASVVRQIDGPVLLVGHSYGGAVITVAGVEDNVVGLVYLAGYALDEGESLGGLQARFPAPPLAEALVYTPFPVAGSDEPGVDVSVDVARFPEIFAPDVDPRADPCARRLPAPARRSRVRARRPAPPRGRPSPPGASSPPPIAPSTPTSSGSATSARR